ncbi:MAG: hypothetical protein NTU57_05005 [Candidatus Aenigmarchaeota archaeon]|nr:hypothetical protein [Candidatus Aenigmarchaeota archaeon]
MKKHIRIEESYLRSKMLKEFKSIDNLRFLSLIVHQYVEYFLNELIVKNVKNPELIIDDRELGTFFKKFTILKAIGLFDRRPDVLRNIEVIMKVRNYYAHNMMTDNKIPRLIIDKILTMALPKKVHETIRNGKQVPDDIINALKKMKVPEGYVDEGEGKYLTLFIGPIDETNEYSIIAPFIVGSILTIESLKYLSV